MVPGALFGGRYRLIRLLGQGGMGVVWHAKNEAIDRDVAIKVMAPGLASNEDALRRFFNEARICGGIRHPGIVDDTYVYWTNRTIPGVARAARDADPPQPADIISTVAERPYGIVVDDDAVYWTDDFDGTVWRRLK
jgi:serine/threonine protein kinase